MKEYYYNFYSNTGIYNVDKIVEGYFNKYEKLKTDIFNELSIICKNGILGRNVSYSYENIENCLFSFMNGNYKISFTATINNKNMEVIVNTIKIEKP